MVTRRRIVRSARELKANSKPKRPGAVIPIYERTDTPVMDMLSSIPAQQSKFRKGDFLHVSDLINKCVRQIALSHQHSLQMPAQTITASMGLTFKQGDAIHDYIKSMMLTKFRKDMYGFWHCRCGDTRTSEPSFHAEVKGQYCELCGTGLDEYDELVLEDPKLKIRGSPDIVMRVSKDGVLYPIELKSISHEQWKDLARAKPDHIVQVVFYWYLLRELGYKVSSVVSVVYATKGFVFKGSPFKEFVIDAEKSLKYIDDYIEDAQALVRFYKTGELPPRVKCSTHKCPDAKQCHVALECFA
jgi:hypothetical protein